MRCIAAALLITPPFFFPMVICFCSLSCIRLGGRDHREMGENDYICGNSEETYDGCAFGVSFPWKLEHRWVIISWVVGAMPHARTHARTRGARTY